MKNFSGVCQAAGADKPLRAFFIWITNIVTIDVGKVAEIPVDYMGVMGVPDTFLGVHNPEQFEILGTCRIPAYIERLGIGRIGEEWMAKYKAAGGTGHYTANMHDLVVTENGKPRAIYSRIIIRRKQ